MRRRASTAAATGAAPPRALWAAPAALRALAPRSAAAPPAAATHPAAAAPPAAATHPAPAAPPAAAAALHGGAVGRVEFALHPGGYVRLGDAWLLVAIPRAPRGPLTLLVTGLETAPLIVGDVAAVDGAVLCVGAHRIDLSALGGAPLALLPPPLAPGWRAALGAALAVIPPPPDELAAGLSALRRGEREAATTALAGRGPGLTPTGDDVLAGYAAWRHAEGAPLTASIASRDAVAAAQVARARCSPLGLAYLECAARGELAEPAAAVLRAIRSGDAALARRRAAGLGRWGASSGHALLWGIAAGACG